MKKLLFVLLIPFLFAFDDDDGYIDVARKYVSVDGRVTLVLRHSGRAVETIAAIHWIKLRGKWSSDGMTLYLELKDGESNKGLEMYDILKDTLKQGGEAVFVKVK